MANKIAKYLTIIMKCDLSMRVFYVRNDRLYDADWPGIEKQCAEIQFRLRFYKNQMFSIVKWF